MSANPIAFETPPVIETQALSKQYGDILALDKLDLQVPRHAIFGFLGPNGAGKTTTIKLLLGLIQPSAGAGKVFGQDIIAESVQIRSRVGYLPQDPRFYEYMTARQTLEFTARFFFKGPQKEIDQRVNEMLTLVDLEKKADRPIKSFSGGERQRLGIAQAEVNYPDLLILDEPAASLDPIGRHDVLDIMERIKKYATIFYSTHILDDVQKVSDYVAILNKGQLIAHGTIDTLLASTGGMVYTLTLKGELEAARQRLMGQPWVTDLQEHSRNQNKIWTVAVSDEAEAEKHILRLILQDPEAVVVEFMRQKFELEDAFMTLVQGGQHG
jgi:ABC-2 type transport system ATP-binding protein